MIKKTMKKILMLTALIDLAAYTISSAISGDWVSTTFLWELFFVSCLICVAQLICNRFKSNYYILEVLVEYLMVVMIVGGTGLLIGWFQISCLWNVFLYVTPVYIISYFMDLVRTRRDVDFINERIKQRAERGILDEQGNDNGEAGI